ncbi:iron uptake system protein EfeO [Amaricoccus sp.]|uniref:iron uptake system protein EfeO n=1 Tax=Amaricoccus sp. TaxID=1872485 RepID=UPI001B5A899A|nr:iron uptake system protein EfeO [Amaricoccus sp.]MBP7243612.1 iron uptake system protein EfeO [Amaricoccus sp.]
MPAQSPMSPAVTRAALAAAGLLVLLGFGAFWYAARGGAPAPAEGEIAITVTASACDPAELTVPAGKTTFRVHNASDRTLEWEILDGVMVLAERENITPGLSAVLTERLRPGTYDITCGLLSNPRGKLTVLATAQSEAAKAQPETRAFIGPLSEYRVYLARRAGELVRTTETLSERIAAGDLAGAREAWLAAREPWRRMAPVAGRVADLANGMDPLADYLAERTDDPGFTGFHRIEYGLWSQDTTDGLAPFAERLASDAAALRDRLKTLDVAPADLAGNAAALASRVANQATASQAPYSGADLAEFSADLDGISKSALLVDPLVAEADPAASATLRQALEAARATLDGLRRDGAFPPYDEIDAADRARIAAAFAAIAAAADTFNPAIGLD